MDSHDYITLESKRYINVCVHVYVFVFCVVTISSTLVEKKELKPKTHWMHFMRHFLRQDYNKKCSKNKIIYI